MRRETDYRGARRSAAKSMLHATRRSARQAQGISFVTMWRMVNDDQHAEQLKADQKHSLKRRTA